MAKSDVVRPNGGMGKRRMVGAIVACFLNVGSSLSSEGAGQIDVVARPMRNAVGDSPFWTPLFAQSPPPSARWDHSSIYDPVRRQMVVFGGFLAGFLGPRSNETWTLALNGAPVWASLAPGTGPSARAGHTATHDPLRDRMILFGGDDGPVGGSLVRNDTWALALGSPAWEQITPSGAPPGARAAHTAIYDAAHDRIVIFGGFAGGSLNDVWTLELSGTPTWVQLFPQGTPPVARYGHSAIYDAARGRMVIFGGYSGSYRNDVWALTLDGTPTWTQLSPAGSPPGLRSGHSAIYDALRDDMVVFGGGAASRLNDTWQLSFDVTPSWTQILPSATPPAGRVRHSATYIPARDQMVVFGGSTTSPVNDLWSLLSSQSTSVGPVSPESKGLRLVGSNPLRADDGIRFDYQVSRPGHVSVRLLDLMGRTLATPVDGNMATGSHQGKCQPSDLSGLMPGVYFIHLRTQEQVSMVKLILMR